MPSVPTAKRRVNESVLPGARVNTQAQEENFGGGRGIQDIENAAQGLLSTGAQIYKEEKDKADKSVLLDKQSKFLNDYNKLWNDPESGFASVKGKQSAEMQEAYKGRFEELANQYQGELANDNQKAMFNQFLSSKRDEWNKKTQNHVFNEVTDYNNKQTESNLQINLEYAVQNYTTPGKVGESLANQEALIQEFGERNGLPPEDIEMKKLQAKSNTHLGVLNQMVNDGKFKTAKAYFNATKDQVSSEAEEKMFNLIERSVLKGEAIEVTDNLVNQGLTKTDALAEARKIEDPDKRDMVVQRLKTRYAEIETIKKEDQFATYNQIGKHILGGGNLDDLPESQVMKLSYKQLKEFQEYERKKKAGESINTDLKVYHELEQLAADRPNAFKQLPLEKYLTKLKEGDFKHFSKLQAGLRKNDQETISELDGIRSKKDIVNQTLNEMQIDYSRKASSDDIKKANLFRERVDNVVIEKQRELGRKLNNNEVNEIVEDLRTDLVLNKGFIWDDTKKSFELGIEDLDTIDFDELDDREKNNIFTSIQRNMRYEDVPQDEVEKITDALRRNGMQVSKEKVVQYYFQGILRKAKING